MSDEKVTLEAAEESGRLWNEAERALAGGGLVHLCEAVELGLRAVEILAVQRLQSVRGAVPATVALLLETPEPAVDVLRDAVSVPPTISFTEIVDMLSEESLECVGPHLHRGWEDRRFACRRVRRIAQEAVGFVIEPEEREQLLLLAAYRNRIFRYPPPVVVEPSRLRAAFAALRAVHGRL